MALDIIVEDGTGVENANTYLSIEEFQDIADMLGYSYSEFTTDAIMQKLIRSSIILDSTYRYGFPGTRLKNEQGLEWPREEAHYYDGGEIASSVVPKEVKYGLVEMVYALGNNLQPVVSANGSIKEERVKVDVIEDHKKYNYVNKFDRPLIFAVDDVMSKITGGAGARYKLSIQRIGG